MSKTNQKPPDGNRYRLATITIDVWNMAAKASHDREDFILEQVEQALCLAPDIILLPELCWCYGDDQKKWGDFAETRDSCRVRHFSTLARRHQCYIGLPVLERRRGKLFNTLLLLDRSGRVVWHYDKLFLTSFEIEMGISRGTRPKAFDTDFGRIGAAICFDLNFFEIMELWREQQVDLILFSSMYRGGQTLAAWAMEAYCFLASATADEGAQIVDPLGRSLGRTSQYSPVLLRELPQDFEVLHIDRNVKAWPELRKKYGSRLHMEIASEEGRFILESRDARLRVRDLIQRHKLILLPEMLAEARRENEKLKALSAPR